MGRVLITGGAGFIGSHLSERMLADGHEVCAVDCFDDYYAPAIKRFNIRQAESHPSFQLLEGDLCNRDWLQEQIGGQSFDIVYHLAARAGIAGSVKDPFSYRAMNIDATLNLVHTLVERCPPTRLVFASSSSVYGTRSDIPFNEQDAAVNPASPYAAFKRSIELLLYTYHHLHKLPVLCLRYFTVYGPRQRPEMAIAKFHRMIRQGQTIPLYGDGSSQRDYSFIDDIVRATAAAAREPFSNYEIINLGGNRRTALSELIKIIERVTGCEAKTEHLPARREELPMTWADISRAQATLGYEPRTSIEEGVQRYHDWFMANAAFLEQPVAAG